MAQTSNSKHPAIALAPARNLGQIRGFDGVRGLAVLIIFVSHLDVILPINTFLVIPGGGVSLDAFFVLSGFLITALLLREQLLTGRIGTLAFYRRRILRLLPALYVVVLATALFAYFTNTWARTEVASILSVSFYYSNYYSATAAGPLAPTLAPGFQHLWSLSFEEQFYFIWPWITVVLLTIRVRLRTVVIVLSSLIVLVAAHRALSFQHGVPWWALFQRADDRADSILWGALLAHIWVRGREPKRGVVVAAWLAAGFLLYCLIFTDENGSFLYRGGFLAIDAACALLLLAILDDRWMGRHLFTLRPLVALGLVSYGFYLWHLPVFFAIRHFDTHWNDVVRVIVAFGVTLALTLLSWFLLERPLMRWRHRLEEKRHAGGAGRRAVADPASSLLASPSVRPPD